MTENKRMLLVGAAIVAVIVLAVVAEVKSAQKFDALLAAKGCELFEDVPGENVQTLGVDGKGNPVYMTTRIPGRQSFKCADGVTRHRNTY